MLKKTSTTQCAGSSVYFRLAPVSWFFNLIEGGVGSGGGAAVEQISGISEGWVNELKSAEGRLVVSRSIMIAR